jgi:microcystin-dependent protein
LCDGTTYNGIKTPDLRGRFVLSSGQGTGLTNRTIDSTGGVETVTLTEAQMPSHNHGVTARTGDAWGNATDGGHTHTSATAAIGNYGSLMLFYSGGHINLYSNSAGGPTTIPVTVPSDNSNHTHTIKVSESSKGSSTAHENMPPFYVLAFIMRVS